MINSIGEARYLDVQIFQQDVDPMDTQKRPFFGGKPSSLVETWKEVLNVKKNCCLCRLQKVSCFACFHVNSLTVLHFNHSKGSSLGSSHIKIIDFEERILQIRLDPFYKDASIQYGAPLVIVIR